MIEDGRLRGSRGSQPLRPRWTVELNRDGFLINKSGKVVPDQRAPMPDEEDIADLRHRLERLERAGGQTPLAIPDERYRDAALLLSGTLEKQREALRLQTSATQLLNEALAEQGQIISGLLLPDTLEPGLPVRDD